MIKVPKRVCRRHFNIISNFRNKNEKAVFIRKKKNLEKLITESQPLAETILRENLKHTLMLSHIYELRDEMALRCPHDNVSEETHICSFCNASGVQRPDMIAVNDEWHSDLKRLETLVERANILGDDLLAMRHTQLLAITEIMELRKAMVTDCMHPSDHLVHYGTHIRCKFCETKISIPV